MKRQAILLVLGLAVAGCGGGTESNQGSAKADNAAAGQEAPRQKVGDALAASADHRMFVQLLQSAGLMETLNGPVPYTVFAPTDAAFQAMSEADRQRLAAPDQRETLIGLLSFHIVPGTVTADDLGRAVDRGTNGRAELATVTGANLSISREGGTLMIGDGAQARARITGPDRIQANGILHSIDAVLRGNSSR